MSKKILNLLRTEHEDGHVGGRIDLPGDITLFTMERAWRNNKPFKSCIPAGRYTLQKYKSPKYGATRALVNADLGVFAQNSPEASRYAILIHPANWARELEGCISAGLEKGELNGEPAVRKSNIATQYLRNYIEEHGITHIDISWVIDPLPKN